ncbi:TIGR01621 family pseudouridine synthase [Aliamphritea ceti]|uniref:TIGR01621 family pseudouridine synthase n=1 Tax=Aliamphritea ceti TaxID=1524258 RepID=UPI0021C2952F|nr:TIGR01621 family pseudouridine synthase [Aliamphritea ceti]
MTKYLPVEGFPDGIQLIADTEDFLLINKPAGISVHKDDQDAGLVMLLQTGLKLPELYLVHRLDRMTSGLLLLAKRKTVAAELGRQFEQRRMTKFYMALSQTKPKKKQGLICGDMLKARRGSWKLAPSQDNPALTQFFSHGLGGGLRVFLLRPVTGKTHQLRVALKSIGAPILGDSRYSGVAAERGYLHAWYLGFELSGQIYRFSCVPQETEWRQAEWPDAWSEPELLAWPEIKSNKLVKQ